MSRIATRDRAAPRRIGTYDEYPPNTRVSVACTMPHRDLTTPTALATRAIAPCTPRDNNTIAFELANTRCAVSPRRAATSRGDTRAGAAVPPECVPRRGREHVSAATDPSRGAHARARVAGDHATDPSVRA